MSKLGLITPKGDWVDVVALVDGNGLPITITGGGGNGGGTVGGALDTTLVAIGNANHADLMQLLAAQGVTNTDLLNLTAAQHTDLLNLLNRVVSGGATDTNLSSFASANHADLTAILAKLVSGGATDTNATAIGNALHADLVALLNKGVSTGAATDANLTSLAAARHTDLVAISTPIGVVADAPSNWFTASGTLISKIGLLIAATLNAGSHVYGYNANNQLITDAWTLLGTTRTKTYTWTSGLMTAESDWV